jgi:uncharacterized protein
MQVRTLLFDESGPQNTEVTLQAALERAQALGITQVVVASSSGRTAHEAYTLMDAHGIRLYAVSISHGWEHLGWCMSSEARQELNDLGVPVVTGIHALGDGVGSAFSEKSGGRATEEIVRDVLYRFCQGMKVAVESVLMAADAGLLRMEDEVIAIAGTDSGADTAIVCKPAYPRTFHSLEIREVLAKPRIP